MGRGGTDREGIGKFSTWHLYSPVPRSNPFVDQRITALLDILEPKSANLEHLRGRGYEIGVTCVGRFEANPGFYLSSGLIASCAPLVCHSLSICIVRPVNCHIQMAPGLVLTQTPRTRSLRLYCSGLRDQHLREGGSDNAINGPNAAHARACVDLADESHHKAGTDFLT